MRTQTSNKTDAFMSLGHRFGGMPSCHPTPGRAEIYGAVICSKNNKYLLVQGRKTGKWSFPKGHTHRYETPFECVCREVSEEVGIEQLSKPIRGIPLRIGYYYYFKVDTEDTPQPRDNCEVCAAGWFSINEMKDMMLNIDASEYLRRL
jgi:8-oxo-dGTP pyrophosphatase MutT (NUDIX family)